MNNAIHMSYDPPQWRDRREKLHITVQDRSRTCIYYPKLIINTVAHVLTVTITLLVLAILGKSSNIYCI